MSNHVEISTPDFDIEQIANSGQCFRVSKISSDLWQVMAFDRALQIQKEGQRHVFKCSTEEFNAIWFHYFDMQRNYGRIKESIRATGDPYLIAAVNYGHGIRILKQDLWEIIVTFLISQQNNIPRIKSIIGKLCFRYENRFPTPDMLSDYTEKDFISLGLGYRAKYLKNIVAAVMNNELNLKRLRDMNYGGAVKFLKRFDGIGDKVANCIALFGLHKVEAFPIDVWIKRIIDEQYAGSFDLSRFSGYAGIVQQYMFFYQKNLHQQLKFRVK